MSRKAAERKEMPFHLSLCPVHVSIHTTSDGKASRSVRLDVLDFHLDSTSNSVHSCNLSISRCSIPRHATHYLHTGEKSQTKQKPLLMKRKISLAPPHPPVGKQTQPPPDRCHSIFRLHSRRAKARHLPQREPKHKKPTQTNDHFPCSHSQMIPDERGVG